MPHNFLTLYHAHWSTEELSDTSPHFKRDVNSIHSQLFNQKQPILASGGAGILFGSMTEMLISAP